MGLLQNFRNNINQRNQGSASVAKERLQILVAHDRMGRDQPSYLKHLEREILEVIRKYVPVDEEAISVSYEQEGQQEILELNIILPDHGSRL